MGTERFFENAIAIPVRILDRPLRESQEDYFINNAHQVPIISGGALSIAAII